MRAGLARVVALRCASALAVREGAETPDRNAEIYFFENKKKREQMEEGAHSLPSLPRVIVVGA